MSFCHTCTTPYRIQSQNLLRTLRYNTFAPCVVHTNWPSNFLRAGSYHRIWRIPKTRLVPYRSCLVRAPSVCRKGNRTLARSSHWAEKLPDFFFGAKTSQKPQELSTSPSWTWLREGVATGMIFGGCLPSVLRLSGTRFWLDHRGRIPFLETSMGEKLEKPPPLDIVRSYLANIVHKEDFEKISGLGRSLQLPAYFRR